MPLIQRGSKKVTRSSALVAVVIHVVLFAYAYFFTEVGDIIDDFVVEMVSGRPTAPPPPPKKEPPKVKMKEPPKVEPKFVVKAPPVNPTIKPKVGTDFMPRMELDIPEPDYVEMAQVYGTVDMFEDAGSGSFMPTVMDVMGKMGLDLTKKETKFKKWDISGIKGRTRGRFTWTMVKYSSERWNSFITSGGLKNLMFHINANTQLKVDANARTVDLESPFNNWVKDAKETITAQEKMVKAPENELLDELKRSCYILTKGDLGATQKYLDLLWDTFDNYFYRKYEFRIKNRSIEAVMEDVEQEGVEPWRKEGIRQVLTELEKFDKIRKYLNGDELKPLWMFAKKAEVMESPMLYMFGYVGVAQINDDMLEVLRTYLHNGGFLWMDDGTTGEGDIQWMENRMFIQKLIGRKETDEMTKQVFKRLSQDDKDVPGYNLIGNEPEPFHPWTYIYFNLPEQSRVYIRIFNKLGIPVRDFDLGELLSGAYADKKTGLKWDCKDQKGEDVGSGSYFFQMEAGLFKKTKQFTVSDLRMLDKSHPLYSSFYRMDKVPIGYTPIGPRPYGNETFGYFIGDHLAIVYNEGNEVIAGTADTKDAAQKEACSKWMTNIIVFAVTQPTGIVSRR